MTIMGTLINVNTNGNAITTLPSHSFVKHSENAIRIYFDTAISDSNLKVGSIEFTELELNADL